MVEIGTTENPVYLLSAQENFKKAMDDLFGVKINEWSQICVTSTNPVNEPEVRLHTNVLLTAGLQLARAQQKKASLTEPPSIIGALKGQRTPSIYDYDLSIVNYKRALLVVSGGNGNAETLVEVMEELANKASVNAYNDHNIRLSNLKRGCIGILFGKEGSDVKKETIFHAREQSHITEMFESIRKYAPTWASSQYKVAN